MPRALKILAVKIENVWNDDMLENEGDDIVC